MRPSNVYRTAALSFAVFLAVLAATPSAPAAADNRAIDRPGATGAVTGKITVLAAASLTEIFKDLAAQFQKANPGTKVSFSFGASSTLAQQIVNKAPADVFASASPATMKTVTDAGAAASTPVIFVRNQLQIATPRTNPGRVNSLNDFERSRLRIVVCAVVVPCGAATQKVFQLAGVNPSIDSYEQDVKAVLTKVSLGEADAGLVYRTDVRAAGPKVRGIHFPESAKAINDYPAAVLKESDNRETAAAWIAFIRSPPARAAFRQAGFLLP